MPDWLITGLKDGITAFFPTAALAAAFVWLLKIFVAHALKFDADLYKANREHEDKMRLSEFQIQIKYKADTEMERLRQSLEVDAYREQVRIKNLHDRQAAIISRLYDYTWKLSTLVKNFITLRTLFSMTAIEHQDKDIHTAYDQLSQYYARYRLYLPDHVSRIIEELRDLRWNETLMKATHPEAYDLDSENRAEWLAEANLLKDKCDSLSAALHDQFQKLVGIK